MEEDYVDGVAVANEFFLGDGRVVFGFDDGHTGFAEKGEKVVDIGACLAGRRWSERTHSVEDILHDDVI